jgi:hypothetical protein
MIVDLNNDKLDSIRVRQESIIIKTKLEVILIMGKVGVLAI